MSDSIDETVIFAKKFLEDMLSFFGLNTDVYSTVNEDSIIELHVPSTHLNGFLIGGRGETIRAIQFMVSNALRSQGFENNRVHVDIADYKKQRAERLEKEAEGWIEKAKQDDEPLHLKPMNAADRRTVHKVADSHGLITSSEGEGRDRHVVLKQKADTDQSDSTA